MVDQLSMKEISRIVEVHINTVYTWKKKLQVFIDNEFLPKRQQPSIDDPTMDMTVVHVKVSKKGNTSNLKEQTPAIIEYAERQLSVLLSVYRQNSSHVIPTILPNRLQLLTEVTNNKKPTKIHIPQEFLQFIKKMRGVTYRNLPRHMSWYRMLQLTHALNPEIVADEIFKICLNKDNLSRSNRLLKKMI